MTGKIYHRQQKWIKGAQTNENPILRFPFSRLLSACIFALLCFSSVGYASPQPSNDVHFCLPLNAEDMQARDSIYAATKHALNLNVGEPRTVRMIYFLTNDRPFRQEVVDSMKVTIRQIQTFYAEQMQAHGHGNKTFRFETDARGEPMVHHMDGQHPDSHYLDNTSRTILDEVEQVFDRDANIYLIVVDNSINAIGTGVGRHAGGTGGNRGKIGGFALVHGRFSFRTAAHELGHAFGLSHDFRDDAYIMSYGGGQRRSLSACNAEFLFVHPYFNRSVEVQEGMPPTIELISETDYTVGSRSVAVQFRLRDLDGLHQVILFVRTSQPHFAAGSFEVKACRGLKGEQDTVVEFDYDGVIPSDGGTSLSNPEIHELDVHAVDTNGNVKRWVYFNLGAVSPHYIMTLEHTRIVRFVTFSPDGATLATGSQDSTIRLWDLATRRNIATKKHMYFVYSAAFSPDGATIAVGSSGKRVELLDVATLQKFAEFGGHRHFVSSVAFSSDGRTLASSSFGEVKLWDVETQRNIATLAHDHWVESVAFSPNGKTLVTGSWGGTSSLDAAAVRLWNVSTRRIVATLEGHNARVTAVAFSPGGKMVASGSDDETIKLWDVATQKNIVTLEEHQAAVRSIAFSPGGKALASGSEDNSIPSSNNTVKLWNVETGKNIATFRHTDNNSGWAHAVFSVAFSPDGATVASGAGLWSTGATDEGSVILWDVSSLELGVSQASFSLSLDGDGAAGDQAVTSLDVSPESVVSFQVFGKNIQDVGGISIRFEYDATQVLYEGFDPGSVLPNAQVISRPGTNPTAIEIWIASFGGKATANSGLLGSIRFRTTGAFSGTTLRLMSAELGRGEQRERITFDNTSVTLQLAALTPDFNGDGIINLDDFLLFVEHLGLSRGDEGYDAKYDLDKDGVIGFGDFLIFASNFGKEGT